MPPQQPNQQPSQPPTLPSPQVPRPQAPRESISSTPYDFIMSSSNASRPVIKNKRRLPLIMGIGLVLVILLFVAFNLFSPKANPAFVTIAQQQTELARVAELRASEIQDPSIQNFVINTQLTISSAQSSYLEYLSTHGAGVSADALGAKFNPQTDTQLTTAQTNGSLDSTVYDILVDQLTAYQRSIQSAHASTQNQATRAQLQTLYDQAALLLEQSKQ